MDRTALQFVINIMNTKTISIGVVLVAVVIGGVILFSGTGGTAGSTPARGISVVDGKQVIEINVKGGYAPRSVAAKANMPSVIKFKTNGTFDCSSAVVIPDLNYRTYLPSTGETSVDVPPQKQGTVLRGLCAMGMYNFSVSFE